jgi:hypothetical protein
MAPERIFPAHLFHPYGMGGVVSRGDPFYKYRVPPGHNADCMPPDIAPPLLFVPPGHNAKIKKFALAAYLN